MNGSHPTMAHEDTDDIVEMFHRSTQAPAMTTEKSRMLGDVLAPLHGLNAAHVLKDAVTSDMDQTLAGLAGMIEQATADAETQAQAQAERETAITEPDDDGVRWIFDVEIGIAGLTAPPEITDRESANWAMTRLACIESAILAKEARKEALASNMQKLINAERKKQVYWEYIYRAPMIEWAKNQLTGKSKTVQLEAGKISFRTSKGSSEIIDNDLAMAFAMDYLPEAVKTRKTISVTDALRAIAAAKTATGEDIRPKWLISTGSNENITFTTGVKTKD